jgi:hypothetical protein
MQNRSSDSWPRSGEGESDLVVRDRDGKPYSVRYDQVNAMLLNEFLEHARMRNKGVTYRNKRPSHSAKAD